MSRGVYTIYGIIMGVTEAIKRLGIIAWCNVICTYKLPNPRIIIPAVVVQQPCPTQPLPCVINRGLAYRSIADPAAPLAPRVELLPARDLPAGAGRQRCAAQVVVVQV